MEPKPGLDYDSKAARMWASFTPNERECVRVGVFPAGQMQEAEREGYLTHPLAVALMREGAKKEA